MEHGSRVQFGEGASFLGDGKKRGERHPGEGVNWKETQGRERIDRSTSTHSTATPLEKLEPLTSRHLVVSPLG